MVLISRLALVTSMDDIEYLVNKAQQYLDDSKFDQALIYFEKALSLNRNDPDLWNNVGITLRSLGRHEESLKYFEHSLKLDPRDRNSS